MEWTETVQRLPGRVIVPAHRLEGLVGCEVYVLDVRARPDLGYGTGFALVTDQGFTVHASLESALCAGELNAPGVQLRELERRTDAENAARAAACVAAAAYERLADALVVA